MANEIKTTDSSAYKFNNYASTSNLGVGSYYNTKKEEPAAPLSKKEQKAKEKAEKKAAKKK